VALPLSEMLVMAKVRAPAVVALPLLLSR